jgi:DNA-binding PadR family transcriptional regulator
MSQLPQLRKGSTSLLLLNLLAEQPMYGYQIMRELERRSDGYFSMTAALLYPALHQLEQDKLVESEWQPAAGERRRKYYQITEAGRLALAQTEGEWRTFFAQLFKTLRAGDAPEGTL